MGTHTLTPEQARQIDWGTLIARLLELRSNLRLLHDHSTGPEASVPAELGEAAREALDTLDAIEALVTKPPEGSDDAAA